MGTMWLYVHQFFLFDHHTFSWEHHLMVLRMIPLPLSSVTIFLEIKCPHRVCDRTPEDACSLNRFSCTLRQDSDGMLILNIQTNHIFYAQVQGMMAVGEHSWCDFVIFTTKGVSVSLQRILFDNDYWKKSYYLNWLASMITALPQRLSARFTFLACH